MANCQIRLTHQTNSDQLNLQPDQPKTPLTHPARFRLFCGGLYRGHVLPLSTPEQTEPHTALDNPLQRRVILSARTNVHSSPIKKRDRTELRQRAESPKWGQMGQVGQMRGRLKFTKLPPTSKLDRLLVSFGRGQVGQVGQAGQAFEKLFRRHRHPIFRYGDGHYTPCGSGRQVLPRPHSQVSMSRADGSDTISTVSDRHGREIRETSRYSY